MSTTPKNPNMVDIMRRNENLSFFNIKIDIKAVQIGLVRTKTTFSESVTYFKPSNIIEAPTAPKIPLEIN